MIFFQIEKKPFGLHGLYKRYFNDARVNNTNNCLDLKNTHQSITAHFKIVEFIFAVGYAVEAMAIQSVKQKKTI